MPADILKQLGELAFASRLRRLSERLMRDVSRVYREQSLGFEPRWFPVLYLLRLESPLPVTGVATRLGLTHAAINQIAGAMIKRGLLVSDRDTADERRRLLHLTTEGLAMAEALEPIWEVIVSAMRELLRDHCPHLLTEIAAMELALDEEDIYRRLTTRLKQQQLAVIKISHYRPSEKRFFKSLNYEWLQKYFEVEPEDEAILSDPNGRIIKPGGQVFFARLGSQIIGTAALLKHNDDTFELTKMAVTKAAQGKQVGLKLTLAALDWAEKQGARTVMLHTSPKLKAAGCLYRKLGFRQVANDPDERYAYRRTTITMKLEMKNWQKR